MRLTWRRLGVLLRHLPRESSFVQAIGGDRVRWGDVEHLLASVVDEQRVANWQYASAHSKRKPKRPRFVHRPGMKQVDGNKQRFGSGARPIAEMRQILDNWSR